MDGSVNERVEAERIAAELGERDGVQVSALFFDFDTELGVKVTYPGNVRHAVRIENYESIGLRAAMEAGIALCAEWKRQYDARQSEVA